MPTEVTNYQCPACTGPLHFESSSGKLECEFCGSRYDTAEIEALYRDKDTQAAAAFDPTQPDIPSEAEETPWDDSDLSTDWGNQATHLRAYVCPSCGAELLCDTTTAATSCPYCGNPTIIPGQLTGTLKPDYIIPFQLSKDDAVRALKKHYKGKILLPRAFTNSNHIEEIKGIYVPFWLFDGEASGSIACHATRIHSYRHGDYEITETDHFDVHRSGCLQFENIPVDASKKMPDAYMDSIEPFDYSQLKPFSSAYLPGYLADKYDVSVAESRQRADCRCSDSLVCALERSITGYATCVTTAKQIHLKRGKVHYALLPVWMLNTRWNGKNFLFAMNGQTGKIVGNLPVSFKRVALLFASIAAPLAALGIALAYALV